jgi:dienelactone hydrolase
LIAENLYIVDDVFFRNFMIETKVIEYQCRGVKLKGFLAHDPSKKGPKPGVIIAHAWRGQDDFARKKAEFLAELGYVGFAADVYGDGKTVNNDEEALANMTPLISDRQLLRDRILAGYDTMAQQNMVDKEKLGALGFCFGGLTVIELLRSGANLRGVVSFHGLIGVAKLPSAPKLQGSLLVLHGYLDPMVSKEDIRMFLDEMTRAEVDWQMNIYGKATHAFSNPEANAPDKGLLYHASTEKRAVQSMINFFNEVFK